MTERFQVPKKSKVDGWAQIPLWVMEVAYYGPRNCFTLKTDGVVVKPEQWIVRDGANVTVEV